MYIDEEKANFYNVKSQINYGVPQLKGTITIDKSLHIKPFYNRPHSIATVVCWNVRKLTQLFIAMIAN